MIIFLGTLLSVFPGVSNCLALSLSLLSKYFLATNSLYKCNSSPNICPQISGNLLFPPPIGIYSCPNLVFFLPYPAIQPQFQDFTSMSCLKFCSLNHMFPSFLIYCLIQVQHILQQIFNKNTGLHFLRICIFEKCLPYSLTFD